MTMMIAAAKPAVINVRCRKFGLLVTRIVPTQRVLSHDSGLKEHNLGATENLDVERV